MNPITIPYHLLFPGMVSFGLLLLIVIKRKTIFKKRKWFWISLTIFLILYSIILFYSFYLSIYYQLDLQSFDLDNNGSFSIDERTPEQQRALSKAIRDTTRNYSFFTGFILAFIVALLTYAMGQIIEYLIRKFT